MMGLMTQTHVSRLAPRLVVSGAEAAIEFYTSAMGAEEVARHTHDGKIVHAELRFGDATLTLKDEDDVDPAPTSLGGTPVIINIDVDDADAVAEAMTRAGARVIYPIDDWSEYGRERGGRLADPFGHVWMIVQ
jgi:uncharacterized glyoxalase superfamily protein PhnB